MVQSIHEDGLYEAAAQHGVLARAHGEHVRWPEVGTPDVTFVIRSERAGTASLMEEIRQAVRSVNASIPIAQERTMQDLYAGSLARTSFTLVMLAIAGSMALALGVIGIYGVIAYVVSQRTREIGIRLALGARAAASQEDVPAARARAQRQWALSSGLVAAVALARLMSSLLFGIGPMDPAAYIAALGVTIAAAALASYLPARRAATIDPLETLKAE